MNFVLSTQYSVLYCHRAIRRYHFHYSTTPLLHYSTRYQHMHCKHLSLPVGQSFPKVLHPEPSILDPRYWSRGDLGLRCAVRWRA